MTTDRPTLEAAIRDVIDFEARNYLTPSSFAARMTDAVIRVLTPPDRPPSIEEALAHLDELEARLAELCHPALAFGRASSLRDLGALHLRSIRRLIETYGAASMPPPPPSAPPAEDFEIPPFRPPALPLGLAALQADDTDPTPPHGIRLPTLAEALAQQAAHNDHEGTWPDHHETFEQIRRRTLRAGFTIGEIS